MDNFVVSYRTFHNSDPPQILRLWHGSNLGPSAAEGFPCDILELFIFSQVIFDRKGFFVAVDDKRVVGFCHAGFAPAPDQSALDRRHGIISAMAVHPDYRRQGVGSHLLQMAERYLAERGSTDVVLGAGLNGNGFYNGIYGGISASGLSLTAAPWNEFAARHGYQPHQTVLVMHRDLTIGQDPVSSRLIRNRRRLNMIITDRAADMPWWWHVRFGHLDALRFELQERHDQSVVASGEIVGLDVYIPKWGVRAVGIRDIFVPENHRRMGYALSLVVEICKRLREQSVHVIEVQIDKENAAARELFTAAKFEPVQELFSFRKELNSAT